MPALDQPLPRGRHGLSPDEIAAHQRARVLAATTERLARGGFFAVSVADISRRAGISRPTFYELYEDKLGCALAAQSRAIEALESHLEQARAATLDWNMRVAATIDSLVAFIESHPNEALLVLPCGPVLSHPELARRSLSLQRQIARELLDAGPATAPAPESTSAEVLIGGLLGLLADELARGDGCGLPQLGNELTDVLISYCTHCERAEVS